MITRRYLGSAPSSSSSIGGLMMPSATWFPATFCLPTSGALTHQGYQLMAHVLDGRVDQRDLELVGRGQLLPGGGEPPGQDLGRLGAAAGEPADQFLPGRRGQEDQPGF